MFTNFKIFSLKIKKFCKKVKSFWKNVQKLFFLQRIFFEHRSMSKVFNPCIFKSNRTMVFLGVLKESNIIVVEFPKLKPKNR